MWIHFWLWQMDSELHSYAKILRSTIISRHLCKAIFIMQIWVVCIVWFMCMRKQREKPTGNRQCRKWEYVWCGKERTVAVIAYVFFRLVPNQQLNAIAKVKRVCQTVWMFDTKIVDCYRSGLIVPFSNTACHNAWLSVFARQQLLDELCSFAQMMTVLCINCYTTRYIPCIHL